MPDRDRPAPAISGRLGAMKILVVEDEAAMAGSLARGLEAEGYSVEVAADGESGLERAQSGTFDAVILDLMLPKLSGYGVVSQLRSAGVTVPVLMLTAKQAEFDQTESLDSGADDFLSKPFSYPVLLARLRALIRRGGAPRGAVIDHGDIRLDTANHRCWRAGEEVSLTRRELSLLTYLLHRTDRVVSKGELLDHVWDPSVERDPNVVEVYVGYLRRKLDLPDRPSHIETVRSLGYRLADGGGEGGPGRTVESAAPVAPVASKGQAPS